MESIIVNLTPHDVVVQLSDESSVVYPVLMVADKPQIARVISNEQQLVEKLENGVEVFDRPLYTRVEGLPTNSRQDIIVSQLVAEYLHNNLMWMNARVYIPDTGPESAIRNENGVIVAVKRLIWYNRDTPSSILPPVSKVFKPAITVPELKMFS